MKNLSLVFLLFASFLVNQTATADWSDTKVDNIIDDVRVVRNTVTGNVRDVANDFKDQLQDALNRGMLLRESVQDFLTWLQEREGPYITFVGELGPNRCNSGSPCALLRDDLKNFFLDVGDLKSSFPAIEKAGFDGSRAADIVDRVPPMILFALDDLLSKDPNWKEFPGKLQSIFDEIGDPDVFSVRLEEEEEPMAAAAPASSATILSSPASDTRKTPTQRFCDRWESRIDNELDPIRANRIKLWMGYARGYIKLVETGLSETIGGCIAGEGSDTVVPNPIKLAVASVEFVLDMIQNSVKTFRENLGICRANRRELEMQVAECIPLVDFKLPSKRDEVYALVVTKLDNAEAEGIVVENSRRSIRRADRARLTDRYDDAYEYLCQAYRRIGKSL